jgi:DNA invertase Pin-like site-specific DNA recombinase
MNQSNKTSLDDRFTSGGSTRPSSRKKADKGLPDQAALQELARTYIDLQRRLWPDLVRAKYLPVRSEKSIVLMADEFRARFLGDGVPRFEAPPDADWWEQLAAAYLRYSCDNSNPRSLDQQLKNVLERAARDRVFVPWEYVFADAAVSGTSAARRGYQMAKAAVELHDGPHNFYVDEIGRASRDAIEALTLGRLVQTHKKRLVGATDGFDSTQELSKIMLHVFAMLHEWFVDQLRSKVRRGMADGFAQGKNLGKPALGYKLTPMTDKDGRPMADDNGRPVMTKVIAEAEAAHVREAFRLFADEGWSKGKIARRLNDLKVGSMTTWDGSLIRQLLRRETYFGVEYYGMTYRVVAPETGDITIVRRPQKEWKWRDVPHLRIVPPDLEAKAKERLKACRAAYLKRAGDDTPGPRRASVYPTVLVRPVCGYCGRELYHGRSGKYATFCCPNGSAGKNGCRLRTYKTIRIVEEAVIDHLKLVVLTPDFIAALVGKANAYLKTESKRPKGNAARVCAEVKELTAKRDRLLRLWEKGDGELDDVASKMKKYKAQLATLRDRLREVEGPAEPLAPITVENVEAVVADRYALLREDVAAVAPILRELTGPVTVTLDEEQEGQRGSAWIARFAVNLVPAAARLARRRNCPTTGSWEYLNTAGWKSPRPCLVQVDFVPKHESLAATVMDMVNSGASLPNIATALGESYYTVRCAWIFARSGERPKSKPAGQRTGGRSAPPKYIALAPEVVRLRDEEHAPFPHIATRLKISKPTARRAYDYAHRDRVQAAVKNGQPFTRGTFVRIDHATRCEIRERLGRGESAEFIASAVGCSAGTVRRIGRE